VWLNSLPIARTVDVCSPSLKNISLSTLRLTSLRPCASASNVVVVTKVPALFALRLGRRPENLAPGALQTSDSARAAYLKSTISAVTDFPVTVLPSGAAGIIDFVRSSDHLPAPMSGSRQYWPVVQRTHLAEGSLHRMLLKVEWPDTSCSASCSAGIGRAHPDQKSRSSICRATALPRW
jgi:hypothetical protein